MTTYEHIYFLGIGGIGMSSMARYFNDLGSVVYGYDKTETELTQKLVKEGMLIYYTEDVSNLPHNIDIVIWTPAIPKTNKLYQHFVESKLRMEKRSVILGELTSSHKNIAIAGTHGKTTTLTLLSHILASSEFSFTSFLGGISSNYNSNFISQGNEWMLEEADEYDRSFLQLKPNIAVISSLDADHLDIYGSHSNMVESYIDFSSNIKEDGLLLLSSLIPQEGLSTFQSRVKDSVKILSYGIDNGDVFSTIVSYDNGWIKFNYIDECQQELNDLIIRLPGNHNIQNATAAIRIATELGISDVRIRESLTSFKGVKRRFEWLHEGKQVLIDDYAHHPEELNAAIEAVRKCYPDRRILGIFQPHLYSRTKFPRAPPCVSSRAKPRR